MRPEGRWGMLVTKGVLERREVKTVGEGLVSNYKRRSNM